MRSRIGTYIASSTWPYLAPRTRPPRKREICVGSKRERTYKEEDIATAAAAAATAKATPRFCFRQTFPKQCGISPIIEERDKRWKSLKGRCGHLPFKEKILPLIVDDDPPYPVPYPRAALKKRAHYRVEVRPKTVWTTRSLELRGQRRQRQ